MTIQLAESIIKNLDPKMDWYDREEIIDELASIFEKRYNKLDKEYNRLSDIKSARETYNNITWEELAEARERKEKAEQKYKKIFELAY